MTGEAMDASKKEEGFCVLNSRSYETREFFTETAKYLKRVWTIFGKKRILFLIMQV
jgi:hypothetical protein